MQLSLALLDMAGWVALLLWGVRMVQTGVERAFGPRLRTWLGRALSNRINAFLAGLGVTTVLQSSTATGLMVTGFAAGGVVDLVPALAVMLGANVGTTLIVQLLSFDVAAVAPILILAGVVAFRRGAGSPRDLGRVLIGLGLLLVSLRQLLLVAAPYEAMPSLQFLAGMVAHQPVLDVILAAAVTWAAHSSVAVVLLVMSLAAKGVVGPMAALAFVLGANIGTAINPVLEGATGANPAARRVPLGNLLNRVLGTAIILPLLAPIAALLAMVEPDPARATADFHTLFNLAIAAAFLPLLEPYAGLLRRWFPARAAADDPARPLYLDAGAAPPVALGAASHEALRLVDGLAEMLGGLKAALARDDHRLAAATKRQDDVLDGISAAINVYLAGLDRAAMTDADHRRATAILAFVNNLESAGDVVERNLLPLAAKRSKRGIDCGVPAMAELDRVTDRLLANLRAAASLFIREDLGAARLLAEEKQAFRAMEAHAAAERFAGLCAGGPETAEASALHLDLLRDLKRVNAHVIAAAAYPVLAGQGELLPSRLRRMAPLPGPATSGGLA